MLSISHHLNTDQILTDGFTSAATGFDLFDDEILNEQRPNSNVQASDFIVDIREYDVPYHVRVSIDKGWWPRSAHFQLAHQLTQI